MSALGISCRACTHSVSALPRKPQRQTSATEAVKGHKQTFGQSSILMRPPTEAAYEAGREIEKSTSSDQGEANAVFPSDTLLQEQTK